MTGELRPGEREERRPEPNTRERAHTLANELNRTEPDRRCGPWYVGGPEPDFVVLRYRYWMPEDLAQPAADVEREYLEQTRRQLEALIAVNEIRWVSIELEGATPDTELVAVFEPRNAPDSRYGMRWRIWPLPASTVWDAIEYAEISYDEFLADGIGAEARLGRLAVAPGTVRWLT